MNHFEKQSLHSGNHWYQNVRIHSKCLFTWTTTLAQRLYERSLYLCTFAFELLQIRRRPVEMGRRQEWGTPLV